MPAYKSQRQQQIEHLRNRNVKPDFFDRFEKHPVRNMILVWLAGALLSLVIWGGLFVGALLLVKAIFF